MKRFDASGDHVDESSGLLLVELYAGREVAPRDDALDALHHVELRADDRLVVAQRRVLAEDVLVAATQGLLEAGRGDARDGKPAQADSDDELRGKTAAAQREYATLRAMGIPRWRLKMSVLAQSFWVGLAGVVLAVPTVFLLAHLASEAGAKVQLRWEVMVGAVTVTMVMALLSGLAALRSLVSGQGLPE